MPSLQGLRILVLDDMEDSRVLLRTYFKKHGAEVIVSETAPAAFEEATHCKFDLVLFDLGLPDEDGCSLLSRIRRWEHDNSITRTPAIAVTAYAPSEVLQSVSESGFDMLLTKPFLSTDVFSCVEQVLAHPSREFQGFEKRKLTA